jgi:uncharacterized repeat protein (TIGR03803 family)
MHVRSHTLAPRASALLRAAVLTIGLAAAGRAVHAQTPVDVLTAFGPGGPQNPLASLTQGADGNLYGTTSQGGDANAGTVFQLTPAGTVTVLYAFTGSADGAYPYAGVIQGTDGNFYGTTSQGGTGNAGTVFQLTPAGTITTLYAFTGGTDGAYPYAGVIQGTDGNFYGTTSQGGMGNAGTVFQLTPAGSITVLYTFTGGTDGAYPYAGVIQATDGNFYGTTSQGGDANVGTVFRLTPAGSVTVLYAFTGGTDGAYPYAGVIQGADGNLYGTTLMGGASNAGAVFELTAGGAFTALYAFTGGSDGAYPYGGVIRLADGSLYGTGAYGGDLGGGTAFRLSSAQSPAVVWNAPAPIAYGTRLSGAQLNATASVPGTFAYAPPAGTLLHAGPQTLTVIFTPADTTAYASAMRTVTLIVTPLTPVVTWSSPADIAFGTALSGTQLNATARIAGTFSYNPGAGEVLGVGTQTLSATFTPNDAADYTTVTRIVTLTVTVWTPVITWNPAAIPYGTPLSGMQLNATANAPGRFDYTPPAGTVLDVGAQTLSVTFTPDDTADYRTTTSTATVNVGIPGASGGGNRYPLQFTPASGSRGLVVAGYQLVADALVGYTVIGNCSYYTVHSGSGRGGGYRTTTTHFNQTCTWDPYGRLLTIAAGAPAIPSPLSVSGTRTVYAALNGAYTGSDSALAGGGFVYSPGSHYSWLTPAPYAVLQQALYTVTATLASDGDLPLSIAGVQASALGGAATVSSTTCSGQMPVRSTCTVTVTYDPTRLRSATGLAYDTLNISVASDAGQTHDFVQSYTIVLTPTNSEGND